MRHSTERPEVYEVGSSIKFDPSSEVLELDQYHSKAFELNKTEWSHPFGNGKSSESIVNDLIDLSKNNKFNMHEKEDYDFDISRSFLK